MTRPALLGSDESADAALAGAVRLIQPLKGYRFSLDAVLLSRFAAERPGALAVDLGCGCGVVALCLLALGGARAVVGVDLQPEMVDRASRAAEQNGAGQTARFLLGDLREIEDLLPPRSADRVVSNPPYRPVAHGRVSPDAATALARHELTCALADVAAAAAHLLAPKGEFCVVYPAARLAALLAACGARGLTPRELRPIYPGPTKPAGLALLRCVKGARDGLTVRAPLFLHAGGGKYSPEAQALLGPP